MLRFVILTSLNEDTYIASNVGSNGSEMLAKSSNISVCAHSSVTSVESLQKLLYSLAFPVGVLGWLDWVLLMLLGGFEIFRLSLHRSIMYCIVCLCPSEHYTTLLLVLWSCLALLVVLQQTRVIFVSLML